MEQLSEKQYIKFKEELAQIEKALPGLRKRQQDALAEGDLSENEEYHTAKSETDSAIRRKAAIEELLNGAEIAPDDKGPRIVIGSKISVVRMEDGKEVGEPRIFSLEGHGSTVLDEILGVESSLGKVIFNGTSGVYKIPDNGGLVYKVTKIV